MQEAAIASTPGAGELRDRYLDLVKSSLTHTLYPAGSPSVGFPARNPARRWLARALGRRGLMTIRLDGDERDRIEGRDWPLFGQTMAGFERLENFRNCIERVLIDDVPGDIIETGVWRGGASIFARAVLAAHGVDDRAVWLADSFQGLPPPNAAQNPADAGAIWHTADNLAISLEEVQENFRRYGLLDEQVRFVEGWFRDTLPALSSHAWSVVRLDGDMYESTMDGLTNLYCGLSPGGFLIVDDYDAIEACRMAVTDFRIDQGIVAPIERIDWSGVYWRKPA